MTDPSTQAPMSEERLARLHQRWKVYSEVLELFREIDRLCSENSRLTKELAERDEAIKAEDSAQAEVDKLMAYAREIRGRRDVHSVYEVLDWLKAEAARSIPGVPEGQRIKRITPARLILGSGMEYFLAELEPLPPTAGEAAPEPQKSEKDILWNGPEWDCPRCRSVNRAIRERCRICGFDSALVSGGVYMPVEPEPPTQSPEPKEEAAAIEAIAAKVRAMVPPGWTMQQFMDAYNDYVPPSRPVEQTAPDEAPVVGEAISSDRAGFTDRQRLEYYLTYRGESRGSQFIEFEMRCLSGDDYPTIEEWIAAIDAAMLASGLAPAKEPQK